MSEHYQEWTDDELFLHFREDPKIEQEFYNRYKQKVKWMLLKYKIDTGRREDLIQEGMIGLFNAIQTFDISRGNKFSTYSQVCIRNKINTALREMISTHNKEESTEDMDGLGVSSDVWDPEDSYVIGEVSDKIQSLLLNLGEVEKKVLICYLDKKNYSQIAKELAISTKKVDNVLMKIKAGLAKKINEGQLDLPRSQWNGRLKDSLHKGLSNED